MVTQASASHGHAERVGLSLRDQEGDHQAEDVDLELVDRLVHLLVLDVAAPYHMVGKGDGHDHADDEEAEAPGNAQLPLVAHLGRGTVVYSQSAKQDSTEQKNPLSGGTSALISPRVSRFLLRGWCVGQRMRGF